MGIVHKIACAVLQNEAIMRQNVRIVAVEYALPVDTYKNHTEHLQWQCAAGSFFKKLLQEAPQTG
jgi:hypothetical protein